MKKIALIALAVMAVVGMFAVQPADAKKVEQDPVVAPIDMPMNDEIQQVNGVSKSTNKETRRLSNNLAEATKVMIKMAKSLEIQVYPRVNIWPVLYIKQRPCKN